MSDTAAAQAATGDPITLALTAAFADAESPAPIDNLTPEAPEETVEEVVEPVEEPEAEPEAEPETTDEPEAEAEVETETPVEDGEVKILTAEEIEAKFARSNTKEGRAYMAQVSAVAREGQEAMDAILALIADKFGEGE